nr:hypothetical protein [Pseudomonas sp. R5(2019)]
MAAAKLGGLDCYSQLKLASTHGATALSSLVEPLEHDWKSFAHASADSVEEQSIVSIRIDDSREGQNLKNASSRRILPLHPALIALGLMQHAETVRSTGEDRLFAELESVRGKLGHAPSKWFGRH